MSLTGEQIMSHWPLMVSAIRQRYPSADLSLCEEMAGGAVLKAWTSRHTYQAMGRTPLSAWLCQVARSAAYDYFRLGRNRELQMLPSVQDGATTDCGNERHTAVLAVRAALDRIDGRTREYLQQRMNGYTRAELNGPEKSRNWRREQAAYKALREALGEIEWHG